MKRLIAVTEQSVYVIRSYGPSTQAVVGRIPVGIDGLGYEEPGTLYEGEVLNTPVEPGKRIEWLRGTDGHTIRSTPVVRVINLDDEPVRHIVDDDELRGHVPDALVVALAERHLDDGSPCFCPDYIVGYKSPFSTMDSDHDDYCERVRAVLAAIPEPIA